MKYTLLVLLLMMARSIYSQDGSELERIGDLIWQNRVILVWSDQHTYYSQIFTEFSEEIEDRDIVWFVIDDLELATNYAGQISDNFALEMATRYSPQEAKVQLIGKDGGVKERGESLDVDFLFGQIDRMPMRINEMKEKSNN